MTRARSWRGSRGPARAGLVDGLFRAVAGSGAILGQQGRALVEGTLERAVEEGTTVVAASHDPDLIAAADTKLELPRSVAAAAS